MKEIKKTIVFIVRGCQVEKLDADEATVNEVEGLKCSLAIVHNVNYHEIDVITKNSNEPELSENLMIRCDGVLMKRGAPNAFFKVVNGVRPGFDMTKPELVHEFVEMLSKKDIDNALIFI